MPQQRTLPRLNTIPGAWNVSAHHTIFVLQCQYRVFDLPKRGGLHLFLIVDGITHALVQEQKVSKRRCQSKTMGQRPIVPQSPPLFQTITVTRRHPGSIQPCLRKPTGGASKPQRESPAPVSIESMLRCSGFHFTNDDIGPSAAKLIRVAPRTCCAMYAAPVDSNCPPGVHMLMSCTDARTFSV